MEVESFWAHQSLLLRILFVDRSKKPFFEKSAINETSFEWTGVDGHLAQQLAQSTTTYRLLDAGNLATNVVSFFRLLLIFDIQSLNLKLN